MSGRIRLTVVETLLVLQHVEMTVLGRHQDSEMMIVKESMRWPILDPPAFHDLRDNHSSCPGQQDIEPLQFSGRMSPEF